jgi:hypothetical protein
LWAQNTKKRPLRCLRRGDNGCLNSNRSQKGNSLFLYLSVLFRPSMDFMKPAHVEEDHLLCLIHHLKW